MVIVKYADTLISKNKLKKLILLKFFCAQSNLKFITNLKGVKHKNVLLSSPFHFKTVKSHLYIPTFKFYLHVSTYVSTLTGAHLRLIGGFESVYTERAITLHI